MQAKLRGDERKFIVGYLIFLALNVPLRPDIYPFSTFPMFSHRTESVSELSAVGPDGKVPVVELDLNTDYVVNPTPRYGIHSMPGPNPMGGHADPELVKARASAKLPELGLPWVDVIETTTRIDADGRVVREETGRWHISQ